MITTQNIYKALKQRLSENFPDITNSVKDVKNPQRPCLYVEVVESHDREVANDTIETNCSFNIVYYSAQQTLLDLTEIEKRLRLSLKKPLKVFTVFNEPENIDEIESATVEQMLGETINKFADSDEQTFRFLEIKDVETTLDEYDYILECSLGFEFLHGANIGNPYDEYDNYEIMDELDINYKKEV